MLGISADTTAQSKLLPCGRVLHMQGALGTLQWSSTRPYWTLGELRLVHACQTLEVIVTRIAEVCGPKAEVDSH